MIIVIPCYEDDFYDQTCNLISKSGTYVSHGVDIDTGRNICLPGEPFKLFTSNHCCYNGMSVNGF